MNKPDKKNTHKLIDTDNSVVIARGRRDRGGGRG